MNGRDLNRLDRTPPSVSLHIDGKEKTAASGGVCIHVNPTNNKPQAELPLAGAAEMDEAVAAAHRAFPMWRATPGDDRRQILNHLADLIEANAAEFARLAALDGGTPVAIGRYAPPAAAGWFRYYAGWADKIEGQLVATPPSGDFSYVSREPYGVIGAMSTWNGPLYSIAMKVPAALAAGNTVVMKPSELAPFAPALLGNLAKLSGLPDGVLNVVPGTIAAAQRLIEHPDVKKISFTGGPATARKVLQSCAISLKPAVLELGGKAANLIFEDADPDFAAEHAVFNSIGTLSGQVCAAASRVLIQDGIYDAMVERIVERVKGLPIGDPFDLQTRIGPLINQAAAARVTALIEASTASGEMQLLTGGDAVTGEWSQGAYVKPTVFGEVDPFAQIAQNEIFGPVFTITRFRTEEEAVAIANGTSYGLGGHILTRDVMRVHRVAAALNTGNVYINGGRILAAQAPFGGTGMSGYGREGGKAGLDEFLWSKSVSLGPR